MIELKLMVQYTLRNQIGKSSNQFSCTPEVIDRYVRSVFDLPSKTYDELCTQACQAEPPIVVLNVSVIEAKNLEAKDLNGFSDPYCILGIVFGRYFGQNEKSTVSDASVNSSTTMTGQNDTDNIHASSSIPVSGRKGIDNSHMTLSRSSFRRFGRSFRKHTNMSDKGQNVHSDLQKISGSNWSKSVANKEGNVPIGVMKSTQVKEQTLNPVWNETFRLSLPIDTLVNEGIILWKPPIVVLNVSVIEAKNLEAKDLNGFSDPYCILGIVFGRYFGQNEKSTVSDASVNSSTTVTGQNDTDNIHASSSIPVSGRKGIDNSHMTLSRSSFRRFGRSFRKHTNMSDKGQNVHSDLQKISGSNWSKSVANKEGNVPIGVMKSTQVKEQTLNPVWNETFRLEIDDVSIDKLHLDIWDHDEETSVLEAVRSLNEIRGVKQLGRYFKQVSQSARKNQTGDMDDFLGCITIDIKDIPSTGYDRWFKLEGRSNRSRVQGEIHLALSLSAQSDVSEFESDKTVGIQEHIQLYYLFMLHQIKQENTTGISWDGNIADEGEIILHQHAIQNGLSEIQVSMSQWIALTRLNCSTSINQVILLHTFKRLLSLWSDKSLTREELNYLSDSFKTFTEHSLVLMCRSHLVFHNIQSEKLLDLNHLLECLCMLHNSRLFQFSSPFSNSLQKQFMTSFKEFVLTRYENHKIAAMGRNDKLELEPHEITQLIMLMKLMIKDLQQCREVYLPIIKTHLDLNAFTYMYKFYAHSLHQDYIRTDVLQYLTQPVTSQESGTKCTLSNRKQSSGKTMDLKMLFVLYLLLKKFENMLDITTEMKEQKKSRNFDWYTWFKPVLSYWIQQNNFQLSASIDNDIQNDQLTASNEILVNFLPEEIEKEKSFGLHSLSSIRTANNLTGVMRTWMLIDWPDEQTKHNFTIEIVRVTCESALTYARQLHEKLRLQGYCDEEGQFDISNSLSVGLNNLELISKLVQWSLLFLNIQTPWSRKDSKGKNNNNTSPATLTTFNVDSSITSQSKNNNVTSDATVEKCKSTDDEEMKISYQKLETLKRLQHNGYSELIRVLNRTIYRMNAKMRPEIRKNVFHLCWSLRSTPVDKAMHELVVYLESNIKTLKNNVSSNLLQRCLLSIWHECLEQYIEQTVKEAEIGSNSVGGPGAYLQLKPNFNTLENCSTVIPLSTHEMHEIVPNLPVDIDKNQVFRAKSTLERLKKSLGILLDFFYKNSDDQITKGDLETEEYHNVHYLIQLYNSSTPEVVEQYFIEKLQEQELACSSSYGKLTVKVSYQRSTLHVDIQRAKNLVPLDSNGLSDPFIIIELLPKHLFSETPKSSRTKIVKNTVDPVFDEHFEFSVTPEELQHPAACLAFTVMDHDLIMSNDFEGCVFIRPSVTVKTQAEKEASPENAKLVFSTTRSQNPSPSEYKQQQICLPLIHPISKKNGALDVLGQRSDTYAQEIYKRWKTIEDSELNQ
ncbi:unnamed protein product [Trichobilharzia szidati]|nr:unnamed protein product [Trichobilharzia szidati]